jgi:hypothetical protein
LIELEGVTAIGQDIESKRRAIKPLGYGYVSVTHPVITTFEHESD